MHAQWVSESEQGVIYYELQWPTCAWWSNKQVLISVYLSTSLCTSHTCIYMYDWSQGTGRGPGGAVCPRAGSFGSEPYTASPKTLQ